MIRDFSDEALNQLLSYCNDCEEWQDTDSDEWAWDTGDYTYEEIDYFYDYYKQDVEVCMQYIKLHHQDLVYYHYYNAETMKEIFETINALDDGFNAKITEQTNICYDPYVSAIQGLIDCIQEPDAGKGILYDTDAFKAALDSIGNGALGDMLKQIDPDTNGWEAIDAILAKTPDEASALEMAAINQIIMESVSMDEKGNIVLDENTATLYEHFFEKKGSNKKVYCAKPLVESIVNYQQEYSQSIADRYAYAFFVSDDELTALHEIHRNEVRRVCAVSDMTYGVFSMCNDDGEMEEKPEFDITYDDREERINIKNTKDSSYEDEQSYNVVAFMYSSNVTDVYLDADNLHLDNKLCSVDKVVLAAMMDETKNIFLGEIPLVSDVKDVVGAPSNIKKKYNEAKEHNAKVLQEKKFNKYVQYTKALDITCTFVVEKNSIIIRNGVINPYILEKKVCYINEIKGKNYSSEVLIKEYIQFCNGDTNVPNLMDFEIDSNGVERNEYIKF